MIEKVKRFGAWRWAPLCVGIIMAVFAMLLGLFFDCAEVDTMTRYAPMAEFFAEGNWQEVFHPRFPLLFQTLAGVLVWATGMPGYIACFLLSTCFWGLAIPLLFLVMERIFDRQTAWLTVVLYIICPMLLTYSLFGLRESLRTLGTLLVVYAIFLRIEKPCGTLLPLFVGMLILCTVRSDTLLLAIILWAVYAWFDRAGWRSWSTVAWCALCVQPMCWVTYRWLGVWLPSSQWVSMWNRLF